jgi:hypothetical protein
MEGKKTMDADRQTDPRRFAGLKYEDFRQRASDHTMSIYEKIGFPDAFRKDFEGTIFADIRCKLTALDEYERVIVDIGPGCSNLPRLLISHCEARRHRLVLMDAQEMLDQLPSGSASVKIAGRFPQNSAALIPHIEGGADAVLVYSVLQHVFLEDNPFTFLDNLLGLLKPGGELLIGDIPNASMRRRFLASEAGIKYHKAYMATDDAPQLTAETIEHGQITDAVILGLVARARAAGFHAYIQQQPSNLPMSNRREDICVRRP